MKLLIVDEDPDFARILSTVLEAEGHFVGVVNGSLQAPPVLLSLDPDVVLIAVNANTGGSLRFLERFRQLPGGHRAATVAIAWGHDDRIVRACAASKTDHLLVRPFSVLELAVLVGGLVPDESGISTEAAAAHLHPENTPKLMRLWARGASGVLNWHDGAFHERVLLAQGGPIEASALPVLRRALHGGSVEFQTSDVPGKGDSSAFAAVLWGEACAAGTFLEARPTRSTVLVPTRLSEVAARMPLPGGLGMMLGSLSGPTGLGRVADQYGMPLESMGDELSALVALGLLTIQEAPAMPTVAPRAPPPTPAAFEVRSARPHPGADARWTASITVGRPWQEPVRSVPPVTVDHSDSVHARAAPPRSPMSTVTLIDRTRQVLPPTEPAALLRRLRREVDMLNANDAWVVLSVPHEAERAKVEEAGNRMQLRYAQLVESETGEAQALARAMLEGVQRAVATLEAAFDDTQREADPGDDSFRAGLRASERGDWALADRHFLAARDMKLDSVRNLAHAGWARAQNPTLPAEESISEGLELLRLAEQLNPAYADGQFFLAELLHRTGEDDAALQRLQRALKSDPAHIAASALMRKLRRPPPA